MFHVEFGVFLPNIMTLFSSKLLPSLTDWVWLIDVCSRSTQKVNKWCSCYRLRGIFMPGVYRNTHLKFYRLRNQWKKTNNSNRLSILSGNVFFHIIILLWAIFVSMGCKKQNFPQNPDNAINQNQKQRALWVTCRLWLLIWKHWHLLAQFLAT